MDTHKRSPALSKKFQAPIIGIPFRSVFDTIYSWIAYGRWTSLIKAPKPLIIFILGSPGAGKGTQSLLLRAAFPQLIHLSYGDLVRSEDRIPGSWVSSLPRRSGSTSPVVPPDAAVQLIRQTIDAGVKRGQLMWLVDGFPRSEAHVKAWTAQMSVAQCTLYFSCPRDILIQRVLSRAGTSGRPEDAVLNLVQERVDRSINERDTLLSALAKHGMRAVEIDATQEIEDIKRIVHTVFWGAVNAWRLEEKLDR